jgi:CDGSH-type Zn-finger protein
MADVTIRIRENGPLLIEGLVTLLDPDGNPYPLDPDKPAFALCRCGASQNRPFCDGSHKGCGFHADERVKAE